MKKWMFCSALMLALAMCACNNKTKTGAKEEISNKHEGVNVELGLLASNKDFVCGMPLETGHVGDTTSYNGKLYGFCSSVCKENFLKDPASYLSQK